MSFYIPKMPSKKVIILRDIQLLKELEVSKDDIIKAKKYELSCRTLRRIMIERREFWNFNIFFKIFCGIITALVT